MEKIYCYVDESGQHTFGGVFVVSVVALKAERDVLGRLLERIEAEAGKGITKWMKSRVAVKQAYVRDVMAEPTLAGRIFYSMSRGTRDYGPITLITIASAVMEARSRRLQGLGLHRRTEAPRVPCRRHGPAPDRGEHGEGARRH